LLPARTASVCLWILVFGGKFTELYFYLTQVFHKPAAAQSKHNQALFNIEYVIWYLAWILKVSNAIFNVPTQTNPTST
jgi:hypothetical protein